VSRDEFWIFTQPYLTRYPSIQALEWIPRVFSEEREKYEMQARQEGFTSFHFTERQEQGKMIPAGQRTEYFPIYYMEPYEGNEAAFGFDLASSSTRFATLTKSGETGQVLATSRISLVQEEGEQFGFLIFVPIYKGQPQTSAERRDELKGFVLGVFRIDDIWEKAISYVNPENLGINIWLHDESAPPQGQELYLHKAHTGRQTDTRVEYQRTLEIAGRRWSIIGRPTREFIAAYQTWLPYSALFMGIVFTTLLTVYLRQRLSELKETKEQTQTIVKNVINAIISIDEQGIVESFNPAAEKIFGYTAEEVIGNNVHILMPEPHQSHHDEYIRNYLRTGIRKIIGINREVEGKRKDGTRFPMELAVSEMQEGAKTKFVGVLTDITERKMAEQALITAKEEAEKANRMKSEFLNVMSHELRTPLTVMLGNLPLLADPEDLPEADEIAEIAQDLKESGQHLLTLINDLLDISKIEAGKMTLDRKPQSSGEITHDVISSIQIIAKEKGLLLETNIEELTISADPVRLKQILLNLLGNAVKFTDRGTITVSVTQKDDAVYFSVADTGTGIKKEDLPVVFDVFRQVDSSSTRAAGGTGLGLAITKKLVELHGGHISVESEVDKGSVFTFSLPHLDN
jgi:PAS domain S-box-containing protein